MSNNYKKENVGRGEEFMNIFLDTTVLYSDYFLNKSKSETLLKMAENGEVNIYISKVVLKEARRHFKNSLQEKLGQAEKALREISKIPDIDIGQTNLPTIEDALNQFDAYYNQLEQDGIINIVSFDEVSINELVNRAVDRIKPFSENKPEFRDAVIWLSYANLAEAEELDDCILVTANSSDYLKEGQLHQDLQNDTMRIRIVKDIFLLLKDEAMKPHLMNLELQEWVENHTIDTVDIRTSFNESENYNLIYNAIIKYASRMAPDDISEAYTESGQVDLEGISLNDVYEFEFEVFKDKIFISGNFGLTADMYTFVYLGDGDYHQASTDEIEFEIYFSGEFNKDTGIIEQFEIETVSKTTPRKRYYDEDWDNDKRDF